LKHLILFEDYENSKFTKEDIEDCIINKKPVFASIVKDLPENDPSEELIPINIDDDGLVAVSFNNGIYYVELKNIEKLGNEGSTSI
jgi:hypothetical protein